MSLIVLGTGTEIGKTVTSAVILARYGRRLRLAYWKPIQTGARDGTDSGTVKRLSGQFGDVLPEEYLFAPPFSPHLAARLGGVRIDPERVLTSFVRYALEDGERNLLIEGAGGLLVPLTDQGYLLSDLLSEMHLPCLLVSASTLGTINHTLLTLEAMMSRGLQLAGVVLFGPRNLENRRAIERFGKARVVGEIEPIRPLRRAGVLDAARRFDRRAVLKEYLT